MRIETAASEHVYNGGKQRLSVPLAEIHKPKPKKSSSSRFSGSSASGEDALVGDEALDQLRKEMP